MYDIMEIFDRENFDKMATDLSTFSYAEFLMKPTYSTYYQFFNILQMHLSNFPRISIAKVGIIIMFIFTFFATLTRHHASTHIIDLCMYVRS